MHVRFRFSSSSSSSSLLSRSKLGRVWEFVFLAWLGKWQGSKHMACIHSAAATKSYISISMDACILTTGPDFLPRPHWALGAPGGLSGGHIISFIVVNRRTRAARRAYRPSTWHSNTQKLFLTTVSFLFYKLGINIHS